MRRTVMASLLLALLLAAMPQAGAQESSSGTVVISPGRIEVSLGETFDLEVTVENRGSAATAPAIVHIDITDLSSDSSVDPEDWTPTLSQEIAAIEAGETASLTWSLQPISSGDYVVYAVILTPGEEVVVVSDVTFVSVDFARSLNPEGVLPVVIAVPVVVGAFLIFVLRRKPALLTDDSEGTANRF